MNGRSILFVDDDKEIQDVVSELLTEEGYRVDSAGNGQQALESLHNGSLGLVLLDLNVPLLDGAEFIAEYRRKNGADAPVIIVSGDPEVTLRYAELGATACLRKPFEINDMMSLVERYFDA